MGKGRRVTTRERGRLGPHGRRKRRPRPSEASPKRTHLTLETDPPINASDDDDLVDEEPSVYQQLLESITSQPVLKAVDEESFPIPRKPEEVKSGEDIENDSILPASEETSEKATVSSDVLSLSDAFCRHFERNLEDEDVDQLRLKKPGVLKQYTDLSAGLVFVTSPLRERLDGLVCEMTLGSIRTRLINHWEKVNGLDAKDKKKAFFSPLQDALFKHMSQYKDLLYVQRDFKNGEEIRRLYCLHALNHVLKARHRILKNNSLLKEAAESGTEPPECLDQGMTRPKVLILVPFRDAALRVVETMIKLMMSEEKMTVGNKKRFREEYGAVPDEEEEERVVKRPESYKLMFSGNIDDCFRLGIQIQRKFVKLYAEFYSSDIIVASPLGLRTVIGAPGDKARDFDFLSSIEVLILDQADVFLMQNWDHISLIFQHLHLTPKNAHNCDISRLRTWHVNGWSKFYRQTIVFSSFQSPEINSLHNKHFHDYEGKVKITAKELGGSINRIAVSVPQVFKRIQCSSVLDVADKRFEYFINEILPEFRGPHMSHTAIFVPSYFDFVRLRNYLKKEEISFAQICEYTSNSNVSRARTYFYHGDCHFLLYTERYHFFRRVQIRGVRHLIFYQLPHYDEFYVELINAMESGVDQGMKGNKSASHVVSDGTFHATCTALYSQFDAHRLARIAGTNRSKRMLSASENVHMFVTGDK